MKEGIEGGLLDGGVMTVTGKTAGENTASAVVWNEKVIRPLDRPRLPNGGLCILRGNLAPEGAVIKAAALKAEDRRFMGRARVFDSEAAGQDGCPERRDPRGGGHRYPLRRAQGGRPACRRWRG